MVMFHKSLDVYQLSLDFIDLAAVIVKQIPRGQSYLSDQLRRAASSIVFNIGEGAGEFAKSEKARFYRMALRSGTECAAIIDVIYRFGIIDATLHERCDRLLDRIVAMLTKLILSAQKNSQMHPQINRS